MKNGSEDNFIRKFSLYWRVKRLYRVTAFFPTVLGFLLVRDMTLTVPEAYRLCGAIFIFSFLLYGGIYAINNISDRKSDAGSIHKKNRVMASNLLDHRVLLTDALISIVLSWILTFRYYPELLFLLYFFVGMNFLYTFVLKHIDQLAATFIAGLTYPARIMVGIVLAGGDPWRYGWVYIMVWFGIVSIITRKIQHERDTYSVRFLRLFRMAMFLGFLTAACMVLRSFKAEVLVVVYFVYYAGSHLVYKVSVRARSAIHNYWGL